MVLFFLACVVQAAQKHFTSEFHLCPYLVYAAAALVKCEMGLSFEFLTIEVVLMGFQEFCFLV